MHVRTVTYRVHICMQLQSYLVSVDRAPHACIIMLFASCYCMIPLSPLLPYYSSRELREVSRVRRLNLKPLPPAMPDIAAGTYQAQQAWPSPSRARKVPVATLLHIGIGAVTLMHCNTTMNSQEEPSQRVGQPA
jgi:hypothetical protein